MTLTTSMLIFGVGTPLLIQNNLHRQLPDYQKAIAISNNSNSSAYVYCVQGLTYVKMGDIKSAIASLEQGVKLDSTSDNNWCKSALESAQQENNPLATSAP